ncbi:nuclear pore complex protein Nup50 [Uranotaenia lowii]|uniref:nuclear pore complex protein Nup50 n=1 Tax=Uranotaenia lowii TaxID=190385 RepID=UPI00247AE716|nr:nuclear pore complex protein Nup50 [Uranotaenia lowii]
MAKRGALSDLNHDNWNEEEESEEAGTFSQASEAVLKSRVIKTARRRAADSGTGSATASVFSGFKGFAGATSTPAVTKTGTPSPFSFLSSISNSTNGTPSVAPAASGGSIASATTSALGASIFASTDPNKKVFSGFGSPPKSTNTGGDTDFNAKKEISSNKLDDYASSIKALNEAVANWISEKVKENALCKLTPIFTDYEKYLKEIEARKEQPPVKDAAKPSSTGFTFGSGTPAIGGNSSDPKPASKEEPASKPFSFGFGTSGSTGIGFSFANVAKPATGETKSTEDKEEGDGDGDEDEPPKVEFTPVEEKDSIYSKRCKLFVKAEGTYSDRGVGTLHIKKVDSKVQVLVRADTSLGNILLNIILNESIPLQRMGKNNVMMVCLPVPESKPPPTPVLLRVKTTEEADELFETLSKHKPK